MEGLLFADMAGVAIGLCASMVLYLVAQLWVLGGGLRRQTSYTEDPSIKSLEAAVTSLIQRNTELRLEVEALKAAGRVAQYHRRLRVQDKDERGFKSCSSL